MVRDGQAYQDLGPDHFDKLRSDRAVKHLVRKLEHLGYHVELNPAA